MGKKGNIDEANAIDEVKAKKIQVRVIHPFDLNGNRFYPNGNYDAEIIGDEVTLLRAGTPYKKLHKNAIRKIGG